MILVYHKDWEKSPICYHYTTLLVSFLKEKTDI